MSKKKAIDFWHSPFWKFMITITALVGLTWAALFYVGLIEVKISKEPVAPVGDNCLAITEKLPPIEEYEKYTTTFEKIGLSCFVVTSGKERDIVNCELQKEQLSVQSKQESQPDENFNFSIFACRDSLIEVPCEDHNDLNQWTCFQCVKKGSG